MNQTKKRIGRYKQKFKKAKNKMQLNKKNKKVKNKIF